MGRNIKAIDILVAGLILVLTIFVTLGFWNPDPYFLEKGRLFVVVLWLLRLMVPVIGCLFAFLYLNWCTGKIAGISIFVLTISCLLGLLLIYPVIDIFYGRTFSEQNARYHPYLQISPNSIQRRAGSDGAYTILCLGGSTTEFADKNGIGWPGRVEELLKGQLPKSEIQVYNAGRQWYTTQHTLINYLLNLRSLRPNMIILMQAVNDLLTNADFAYISHGTFRSDYGHFYGPVNRLIERPSFFKFISDMTLGLWYYEPREILAIDTFPGLQAYERNLKTLLEIFRADGTKAVLMTEPHLFKIDMSLDEQKALHLVNYESVGPHQRWSYQTALNGMNQYNQKLKQVALESGAVLIDLEQQVPKDLVHFYDEVHYRDISFDLVARLVSEGIRTSKILRAPN